MNKIFTKRGMKCTWGVIVLNNNIKWGEDLVRMVGKLNKILGKLKRTFESIVRGI